MSRRFRNGNKVVPWYINFRCPGSNYCGAGNSMDLPVVDNGIDWACKKHDETPDYDYARWNKADDVFISDMSQAKPKSWEAWACKAAALSWFHAKRRYFDVGDNHGPHLLNNRVGVAGAGGRVGHRKYRRVHLDKIWYHAPELRKKKKKKRISFW